MPACSASSSSAAAFSFCLASATAALVPPCRACNSSAAAFNFCCAKDTAALVPACSALSSSANARCFCCARATAALVPSCRFMGESIMSFPPRTGRLAPATIEVGRISASLSRFMRSYWIRWLRNSFVRRLASARSPSARAWLACSRRFCSSACCVSSSFDFTIC